MFFALAGPSAVSTAIHPENKKELPSVFLIGSSFTIQFGPYFEKALDGRFRFDRKRNSGTERAEDDLDIPKGASGGDSSMVLAYLRARRDHDPILPGVLLLQCGLHDMKTTPSTGVKQVPLDAFRRNLKAIITEGRAMNQKIAWMRITPVVDEIHNKRSTSFHRFAADVDAYNKVADEVMKEARAEIIDTYTFCLQFVPNGFIDHIHYTEEARRKQGEFIAQELITRYLK